MRHHFISSLATLILLTACQADSPPPHTPTPKELSATELRLFVGKNETERDVARAIQSYIKDLGGNPAEFYIGPFSTSDQSTPTQSAPNQTLIEISLYASRLFAQPVTQIGGDDASRLLIYDSRQKKIIRELRWQ
jgi:hypothetical protein